MAPSTRSVRLVLRALVALLAVALVAGCAGRKGEGPRYRPVEELMTCREGECVQAELSFHHWANAEFYRGKMIYHATPGAELDRRPNPEITRLIIAVHGVIGNTAKEFEVLRAPPGLHQLRWMVSAMKRAQRQDPSVDPSTIAIIAPTFQRTGQWQPYTDEDPRVWTWNRSSYSWGTMAPERESFVGIVKADSVSSFDVLDEFLRAAVIKFPNLEQVVIAGHSAGGQTVHRYVWMGVGVHERLEDAGIAVRYMPANPGGYAFPLRRRKMPPGASTVRPGVGRNDTHGWQWGHPRGCEDYDDWGAGLSKLDEDRHLRAVEYAIDHYLRPVDRKLARKAGNNPGSKIWQQAARKALALQYASREVWHMQASTDTHSTFPTSCRATLQGRSRFERFSNFQEAWRLTGIAAPNLHFVALDGLRHFHSSSLVYASDAGIHVLFH